jgi:hypothetical protein
LKNEIYKKWGKPIIMSKNEKYFLNSSHAALSSFQSSGRITANMRFRLRLHPNCLWSQAPDGNYSYSRNVIYYNDLIVLSEKNIDLLKMILKLVERVYIMKEKREHHLLQLSASERYRIFSQEHPELEKLVKSYHVASYLGITPEALSRIRKKSKKPKN